MSAPGGSQGPALLAVRVARRTPAAAGVCALELVAEDGDPLPPFSAGAHVDLHLPGGLVRPYSLCGAPAERDRYRLGVLREPASRGGSAAVHELLHEGTRLRIGAPRNLFRLAAQARRHTLLAGGIGITPLLAMAEQLAADGADFRLHYAARSRERAAFLDRIAAAPWADRLRLHLDDGPPARRLDLAALTAEPADGHHLYVCGPAGLIDAALARARAAGWPEAQLHHERFGTAGAGPAADAATAGASADGPFEVQLGRDGRVVAVPAGCSVVQALAAAGVALMTSCEQGVCGTCLTGVLDGEPDHRDSYLTPEEQAANDQFTPCCSRARSPRLVLDL
ncbi:PDR/VanB family oxidoreductase [Piscinibacter sakaiensis]|uniref:Flavodoxin reductase (Ferredoxin-NADPH reductase) family 1 n=1 Tax=Piscinibacter sakaiensis TaxID=1547922 RepID=A0A0K8P3C5_PISS1|nr:PDR/VanB family oxidoreductase [Piscinibacter sakaiensis]GAP36670.1 flavodoxin reductase (ferredoxin-NADPH reductase) family 1 [Piscinibacter sakaiensis]